VFVKVQDTRKLSPEVQDALRERVIQALLNIGAGDASAGEDGERGYVSTPRASGGCQPPGIRGASGRCELPGIRRASGGIILSTVEFGTISPPPPPSPTRGEGEPRHPPPPGGRENQGTLPHQGGGRTKAPSPLVGEGGGGGKGKNVQSPRAQYNTPVELQGRAKLRERPRGSLC
jgi:hypothetical protein